MSILRPLLRRLAFALDDAKTYEDRKRRAALDAVAGGQGSAIGGPWLRSHLRGRGFRMGLVGFYVFMEGLEEEGLVASEVRAEVGPGFSANRTRAYRLTPEGRYWLYGTKRV